MKVVSFVILLGCFGSGNVRATIDRTVIQPLSADAPTRRVDLFNNHRRPHSRPRRIRAYLADNDDTDDAPAASLFVLLQGRPTHVPAGHAVLRSGNVRGAICPGIPPPLIFLLCTLLI